jgi:hypothetical protein
VPQLLSFPPLHGTTRENKQAQQFVSSAGLTDGSATPLAPSWKHGILELQPRTSKVVIIIASPTEPTMRNWETYCSMGAGQACGLCSWRGLLIHPLDLLAQPRKLSASRTPTLRKSENLFLVEQVESTCAAGLVLLKRFLRVQFWIYRRLFAGEFSIRPSLI